jgi:hypothetical protein
LISSARAERFRRLADVFRNIKAEGDSALQNNRPKLFVSTPATKAIRHDDKFIFIGRKGSGKTALIFDYIETKKTAYNVMLTIEKDKEPHWHLYNFYYDKFAEANSAVITRLRQLPNEAISGQSARDINVIFDPVSLFSIAWVGAIQVCIADAIVHDEGYFSQEQFREERAVLKKFLFEKFHITPVPSTRISDSIETMITAVCDMIQEKIDHFIKERVPSVGILLARITKWAADKLTSRIVEVDVDNVLRKLLRDSQLKVLISMDKYDDLVDELVAEINSINDLKNRFPKNPATIEFQGAVRHSMLRLQQNMLKGLLLASRKLREDQDYRNVHFAFAIPDDRYSELELREGANLSVSHVQRIRWSPLELVEFFVKRCAVVLNEEGVGGMDVSIRDTRQLKQAYYKVIELLGLPSHIAHGRIKSATEEIVFYIIRHTLCRPRDVLRYFNKIFSEIYSALEKGNDLSDSQCEDIIRKAVNGVSPDIITQELIVEFKAEYQGLDNVFSKFINRGSELDSRALGELLDTRLILAEEELTKSELAERLYRLGFLGVHFYKAEPFAGSRRLSGRYSSFQFVYDDSMGRPSIGRKQDFLNLDRYGDGAIWVIHPLFFDYLRIQTKQSYIVNYMDWETVVDRYGDDYHPMRSSS